MSGFVWSHNLHDNSRLNIIMHRSTRSKTMMLRSLLLLLLSSVVRPRELSLIVGGYKAADRHDENVQTAAKFAVTSLMQDAPYDTLTVTSMDDIHIAIASAQVQVRS
jgi:hypothetical protein